MAKPRISTETRKKYGPWGLRKHDDEILTLRLQGHTLQHIADVFGTSRESVRNAVARQLLAMKVKGGALTSNPQESPLRDGDDAENGEPILAQGRG